MCASVACYSTVLTVSSARGGFSRITSCKTLDKDKRAEANGENAATHMTSPITVWLLSCMLLYRFNICSITALHHLDPDAVSVLVS